MNYTCTRFNEEDGAFTLEQKETKIDNIELVTAHEGHCVSDLFRSYAGLR